MSRFSAAVAAVLTLALVPAAASASGGAWRTVTFDRTIQAADRAALDRVGAAAVQPMGGRSYVAFMDRTAASALQRAPHVRSVARVAVAGKIDRLALRPGARAAQVTRVAGGALVTQTVALDAARTPFALARRADVLSVTSAPTGLHLEDEGTDQLLAGNEKEGKPTPGYFDWLATGGIDGTGVRIAVVDTGVDPSHPDLDDRVVEEVNYDPPNPAGDVDEQGHGTHVAGIIAGRPDVEALTAFKDPEDFLYGLGVAPGAEIVAINGLGLSTTSNLKDHIGLIPTYARDTVRSGSVAWNASWHTGEGEGSGYLETVRVTDSLVRDADPETPGEQPLMMVFSAGNAGSNEQSMTVPHEAKNIISVASSKGQRAGTTTEISSFSSRGPAADGRIMPIVTAPGEVISSARSKPLGGLCFEPADVSPIHSTCSGTSMAAPHVAGSVALLTQWWKGFNGGKVPSPAMMKALFVNTAEDLGDRDVPNHNEGWGRVDNAALLTAPAGSRVYDDQQTVLTDPGAERKLTIAPVDPAKPLRVTVAWTDVPGVAAKNEEEAKRPSLVNDLDLSVTSSRGFTYLGNRFDAGRSVSGGAPDRLNNIENVWLDTAPNGPYTVSVKAAALPGDGVPGSGDTTDQDYALVISNGKVVETPAAPVTAAPAPAAPAPTVNATWAKKGRATVVKRLVASLPAAGKVTLACKGKGCPKRGYTRTFPAAAPKIDLTKALRKARLGKGAVVTVKVRSLTSLTVKWTMGKAGKPREKRS